MGCCDIERRGVLHPFPYISILVAGKMSSNLRLIDEGYEAQEYMSRPYRVVTDIMHAGQAQH